MSDEVVRPWERIIVALDVPSLKEAGALVEQLVGYVGCFKVGLELITAVGAPQAIEFVRERGGWVFFDGKFCDISNTVGGAAKAVAQLGVWAFNVHASAGPDAIKKAVVNKGNALVFGVTVLTSLDPENCQLIFGATPGDKVTQMAEMLVAAGADGIICSPQELGVLAPPHFDRLIKVTPGVRPTWASANDQKRVTTPGEAVQQGADYVVAGRPITQAPKEYGITVVEAAKRIAEELRIALTERS